MSERCFPELLLLAEESPDSFLEVAQPECLAATRAYAEEKRLEIHARHEAGESGGNIVGMLSDLADEIVLGVFRFALCSIRNPSRTLKKISLCAQGGFGRRQLNPYSDLDIALIYDGRLDKKIRVINEYMVPFLWDLGYGISFVSHSVDEAVQLAKRDYKVYTSYLHCRLLAGGDAPYAKLCFRIQAFDSSARPGEFAELEAWDRADTLENQYQAIYAPEPNVKEGAGGLRDYHSGLWLTTVHFGAQTLDGAAVQGLISEDERLELAEALDLVWRVRNELHFTAGKAEDRLTYASEETVAIAFWYTDEKERDTTRFMKDYYRAARTLRNFLRKASRLARHTDDLEVAISSDEDTSDVRVVDGELYIASQDEHWFEESPSRLMSIFWESARRNVPLSAQTQDRVAGNLELIGDTFRSNDLVRRFFLAICSRPYRAGMALRQAAHTGVLERYLPEFAAVRDIIRYEDFHSFPVDEHTLRAVEGLARVPDIGGAAGEFLSVALEHLPDPHILVLALLFHDLGKASGEEHSAEGMRLAYVIGERIGLPEEDTERIAFLVKHHLLMTHNALYRDVDDMDVVDAFTSTMKTENRLRALFLLSYCDLSAVGPNVWSDWKGSLLLQLYLKTEKALLGSTPTPGEAFWKHPKADQLRESLPETLRPNAEGHLRDFGDRYFAAFSSEAIAAHMACLEEADAQGFAVRIVDEKETGMSQVVICTRDHRGLFQELAGCFVSQLVDVQRAALFTRSDGMALDCFTVVCASRQRALTERQARGLEEVIADVLGEVKSVEEYIEGSQRRIFTLLHPPAPVRTRIHFDNEASRRFTVIDIITGDRTGLLYDVAHALTENGLDIESARIVTDARRIRDSFYIAHNGEKLESSELQAEVEEALIGAIHARPTVETKGGSI